MSEIQVISGYRDNEELRLSFNALAKKTFGSNFEDWYQNGYWTDRYNPHSIMLDGKIVANVSVNRTDFEWNGEVKHLIQLGTVMTYKEYRNQGLIRRIMEAIEAEYYDQVDGVYLFAGNNVLEFYPKFGLQTIKQFEYVKDVASAVCTMEKVDMSQREKWDMIEELIRSGARHSSFDMVDNSQLNMFYLTKYMRNDVYYNRELGAYVVAEVEGDTVVINQVIAKSLQDLNRIAEGFGPEVRHVVLGFTPVEVTGFTVREMDQDDRTMHVLGAWWPEFEENKLMVPLLAHA
ncbi:MAG: GNAT family N-acetyltransferase [Firmicutes bacterium]|nr:GNAT family N-acetyltransferase [Bacillota bacterium]